MVIRTYVRTCKHTYTPHSYKDHTPCEDAGSDCAITIGLPRQRQGITPELGGYPYGALTPRGSTGARGIPELFVPVAGMRPHVITMTGNSCSMPGTRDSYSHTGLNWGE